MDDWNHLLDSPWFTLLRIHDHIWTDRKWKLDVREKSCRLVRRKMYEVHLEQCLMHIEGS